MYLSKSTFIRGYDCPVRIRHAVDKLASRKEDDDFLRMLAEGGFQFECLVRHAWPGTEIRGDIRDPQAAHRATFAEIRRLLAAGGGVLHEATLFHGGCAARVDMLRVCPGSIDLCEIKAKSFDGPSERGPGQQVVDGAEQLIGRQGVRSEWLRYVADVAFQQWVAERALLAEGLDALAVHPRLIVANKNASCGEFDSFENILIDAARAVESKRMTSADLAWVKAPPAGYRSPIIVEVDVSEAVKRLRTGRGKSKAQQWAGVPLDQMAAEAAAIVSGSMAVDAAGERGFKCRDCEFRASDDQRPESGFSKCWGDSAAAAENLVTLYYGASYTPADGSATTARSDDAGEAPGSDWVAMTIGSVPAAAARIASLPPDVGDGVRAATRNMQIAAEQTGRLQLSERFEDVARASILCGGRASRLHFLDFETTMACIPLARGMRPYEVVAFQFSCHSGSFDGQSSDLSAIRHASFLNATVGAQPSVLADDRAFVDELRKCLGDEGTPVFHWAAHERTILKRVMGRLTGVEASDRDSADEARIAFIAGMVGPDGKTGRLVDMRQRAEGNIMAPGQQGRYSMKQLLPAICREDDIRGLVWSLMDGDLEGSTNTPEKDPYKLLPPLPGQIVGVGDPEQSEEDERDSSDDDGGIRCGTEAMRAFQQLRFGSVARWKSVDREQLVMAMKRYCKLDTVAMVSVWTWMAKHAFGSPTRQPNRL
jgi:hypothetical protein